MARRSFTLAEANRMLPLVKRVVEDLVVAHGAWQQSVGQFEIASAGSAMAADVEHHQREIERHARDIDAFLQELRSLGVEFKGFEEGLVEFPSEREGRPVYLSWKLGESAVAHRQEHGSASQRSET
ncbi:MAG: DUF2203 domain-containing protein [Gemmatimonadaceae bacterium]